MIRIYPLALILLISISTVGHTQNDNIVQKLQEIAIFDQKVMMPMRDGIRLATDIYRPKTDKSVPIIFSKTPYNFNTYGDGVLRKREFERAYEALSRGYAYVVQNERGRFFSEGEWDILGAPTTDGYDAFTWMKEQPWSNGKIGTLGCSSTAEWQMAVAALDHPSHAAMVPMGFEAGVGKIGESYTQGAWYRGGVHQMLFIAWMYSTQHDIFRPRLPKDITQKDLLRIQKFYDMAPEMPKVDWSEAFFHLPLSDIFNHVNGSKGVWDKMIVRKPNDPDWYKGGLYHDNMPFGVPSLWFMSWYDFNTSPSIALVNHVKKIAKDPEVAKNQYMVIGPETHCGFFRPAKHDKLIVGERDLGDARYDYNGLIYSWFDYWLKEDNNSILKEIPPVTYYSMGNNEWKTAQSWPPENSEMIPYYLNSDGKANSLYGDGSLKLQKQGTNNTPDSFTYNPYNPVPSYGGNVCCMGGTQDAGAFDQQQQETRNDILVYSTDVLSEGVQVTGFIEATLYVSSDVKDTDFTLKLIDVYPDGRAYNLDETIQRVRYREGYEKEVFMEEGQVYKVKLPPLSTSNFFKKGHQIRIEISSSNFPRFERNLNTGGNNYDESEAVTAHNKIHHSKKYPSQIRLPIVK
jgi:putative CocE/NonD family hydrolase